MLTGEGEGRVFLPSQRGWGSFFRGPITSDPLFNSYVLCGLFASFRVIYDFWECLLFFRGVFCPFEGIFWVWPKVWGSLPPPAPPPLPNFMSGLEHRKAFYYVAEGHVTTFIVVTYNWSDTTYCIGKFKHEPYHTKSSIYSTNRLQSVDRYIFPPFSSQLTLRKPFMPFSIAP